ncbi:MAG: 1-acyl-sn-glycerol-3-phosphate acyltransferase [Oscillospiraceae bacterium]|jgi:1-acyl-sn-glycerol-3-phosphate acyltransferase|nr:1-acyl-sn-glycerol-3-phosphate acyltransferase [Oscillospiraceae bacterium]
MKNSANNFFYRFLRYFVQFYFFFKYKIKMLNRENLPKLRGGYIIACNHQRYTDPPAIAASVKGVFSFMAKEELFHKNPFFTLIIRLCGAFPVVRGAKDNSAIERAVSDLKKGKVFVIFPEGTRSKDGKIGRAKTGVALIASTANVPVLPVCIMYGLGGKKKNIDIAVGGIIPAQELRIDGEKGRGEFKRVSERIIGGIKDLQRQILTERGMSADDFYKVVSE